MRDAQLKPEGSGGSGGSSVWAGGRALPQFLKLCLMRMARDREGEAVQKTAEAWDTLILVLK